MKRPLRSRVWFYHPGRWRPGLRLVRFGGDEFEWHTIVVGSRLTGAVVFATRPCPQTGGCAGLAETYGDEPYPEWPVDGYGHNHIDPNCNCDSICNFDEDCLDN